jgi:HEAT repeat protein
MIGPSDFKHYLQSIIDAPRGSIQHEARDRYIPTLAELPLQVKTFRASKADLQDRQEEKPEQLAVLDGLRQYGSEHVLLVGKPGSGKSTSLQRFLLEEAENCLEAIEQGKTEIPPLPILIELRGLSGSILAAIQEKLGWLVDLDEQTLKALLRDRRLLPLLDGLNELPNEEAWQAVDQFRQVCVDLKVPLIITTRELGSGLVQGKVKKLEMLPLTKPQMWEFVQKRLPEAGKELWRRIQGQIEELAETPLLLQMLCDVFAENGEMPKSRGDLFRKEFARRYEEFKPERQRNVTGDSRRFAQDLLSYLAFMMIQGEPHTDPCKPSASWITIPKTQAEKILATFLSGDRTPDVADMAKAKEWLEDLLEWHLLQVASDLDRIEFHHQLFQEYYAAEWLLPKLAEWSHEELKHYYLNYLKWTEPLAMALTFVESESLVVRMVELALEVDLQLGARLAGEAATSLQEATINFLLSKGYHPSLAIWLLEQSRSQNALPFVVDVLNNGCSDTRWRAARALGNFEDAVVAQHLIRVLHDEDDSVRRKAAESLGKLANLEAVPYICQLIDDENWSVRFNIIDVLGKLKGTAAINCLKTALKHSDYTVRTKAAEYLGQLVPQEVIPLLNEEFISGDDGTKRETIQLLCETRDAAAIPILVHALSEDNWIVRSEAASQIGLLGIWLDSNLFDDAVTKLISLLQDDPEISVRSSAALSLGLIGDSRAVPILIEALCTDNQVVRFSAVNALRQLRAHSAINVLIKALEDTEDNVRKEAIRALRVLSAVEALPTLRKLLQHKAVQVRCESAYSFGFLGDSKDLPNLYKALQDTEFSVRVYAAYSLSQLNNRKGIPVLEEALKNGNKEARETALNALKNFDGKVGLLKIIERAFKDNEYSIRKNAVEFLESFRETQEVANQLRNALASPQEDICRNAMDAAKTLGDTEVLSPLRRLAETIMVVERPLEAIAAIQSRYLFYNYEIAQSSPQESNRNNKIENQKSSQYIFPSATEVKIFERVEQYFENTKRNPYK